IRAGAIVEVTSGAMSKPGLAGALVADVGTSYVLPGSLDMHNHLAYNALPLWFEPGRTTPWLHNHDWPDADTYTPSITEPAYTYAKGAPQALLGYVQVREMAGAPAA